MSEKRWRELFPWPIGTHWCGYETGLAAIVAFVLTVHVLAVLLYLVGILEP
jgi:hypothetical protein